VKSNAGVNFNIILQKDILKTTISPTSTCNTDSILWLNFIIILCIKYTLIFVCGPKSNINLPDLLPLILQSVVISLSQHMTINFNVRLLYYHIIYFALLKNGLFFWYIDKGIEINSSRK
jgi:hypothetical protein